MRLLALVLTSVLLGCVAESAQAQTACASAVQRDLIETDPATGRTGQLSLADQRRLAEDLLRQREREKELVARSILGCRSAELFKRVGDVRAERLYRAILKEDPENGELFLLYGDYLRNYRGPGQPLVYQAARQYYEGLKTADTAVANLIRRSLLALYERDGISLGASLEKRMPGVFFSSQNLIGHSPDDIFAVDTIRTETAAALFASSRERADRVLNLAENLALIRNVSRGRTFQRVRARLGPAAVDGYFEGLFGRGSQVCDFKDTASRCNVGIGFGGAGIEYVGALGTAADILVRGDVKIGSRTGLIETRPNEDEAVRSTVVRAVASRFVGPDKLSVEAQAGHDDVTQHTARPINRNQTVWGMTGRYQMFRPIGSNRPYERPIASRGSEFFAGIANAAETFGDLDVARRDTFVGVALKGLPGGARRSFDFTVQPTWFSYERHPRLPSGTFEPLPNRQIEVFLTALYRLVDNENERNIERLPHLVFLNVVGLASFGMPRTGIDTFERRRFGTQLDTKLVSRQQGGLTWLVSGRYEVQQFVRLGLRSNVASASVNLGF